VVKKEKPSEATLGLLSRVASNMRGNARVYWLSGNERGGNPDTKRHLKDVAQQMSLEANALREVLLYLGVRDLPPEPLTLDEVKS
jgi:hypothetical protein